MYTLKKKAIEVSISLLDSIDRDNISHTIRSTVSDFMNEIISENDFIKRIDLLIGSETNKVTEARDWLEAVLEANEE